MKALVFLIPEIFLAGVAFVVMLGEAFWEGRDRLWIKLSAISLILTAVYFLSFFAGGRMPWAAAIGFEPVVQSGFHIQYQPIFHMVAVDSQAMLFKLVLVLGTAIILGFSLHYREFDKIQGGTYSSLLLFGTVGMMFLVSSLDFLLAVISLELLGITSFILTGFVSKRRSSSEGALKFFLVGTFSTALLLFGISYYYGYFGSTHLDALRFFIEQGKSPDYMLIFIMIFLISGLGFKLAMVPFHMWAPDAYEGAPTPVTAFLSVAPKAAAIGFLLRVLSRHAALHMTPVIAVLAALTMTVGNVGAIRQNNVKRLLAYSSVAQVGYILVAFAAGGSFGVEATIIYTVVYLFMNLGVFAVLIHVADSARTDEIGAFAGLSKTSFGLSLVLILFLLSMSGIPPLAGFVGKFAIFASIIKSPTLLWLGIVAVLNSVVSLYYYFRIAQQAFFRDPDTDKPLAVLTPSMVSCLALTLIVTVGAGLFPNSILGWVRSVVGF